MVPSETAKKMNEKNGLGKPIVLQSQKKGLALLGTEHIYEVAYFELYFEGIKSIVCDSDVNASHEYWSFSMVEMSFWSVGFMK